MSIQSILSASASMARIQTIQSVRSRTQGQMNVLNAEIKQDGPDPDKEEQVKALEKRSDNLMGNLLGELNGVNETLKPEHEPTKPEDDSQAKEPNTDKVELSKAAEAAEESKAIQSETTALYDAAGKVKEEALPSERILDVKA